MEVGSAIQASGVNDSVESVPISETVTSSEAPIEGGHVGAGEEGGEPSLLPPTRPSKRQRA
jgi:hypothetical protein